MASAVDNRSPLSGVATYEAMVARQWSGERPEIQKTERAGDENETQVPRRPAGKGFGALRLRRGRASSPAPPIDPKPGGPERAAIDELAPWSSHERRARAMDRLDPFEVTMLRGCSGIA